MDTTTPASPTAVAPSMRFTVGSRPQRRFSNTQTVSNTVGASFAPIQLVATGFVRRVTLYITQTVTFASGAALVAGDAPFNLINGVTLTDPVGKPITQPISGYNLSLVNKYFPSGGRYQNVNSFTGCQQLGPEYAHGLSGQVYTATFRLDLDLEQDANSGYGSIPNLDSNASLQLKIDYAPYTNAVTGTTPSAVALSVYICQEYWAPIGKTIDGQPVNDAPVGVGDYLETRYETQTVTAAAENTVQIASRGGLIKGILLVSRNAGVRTAFAAGSNVGTILDNTPIDEGIKLEDHLDNLRRTYGFIGADLTTSYAPLSAGVLPGLDRGVLPLNFAAMSGGRDSWLNTRVGSLLQSKFTPGAGATQLEIITLLGQIRDGSTFYAPSSLD